MLVVKRDGRRETFSREKLLSGIRKACEKRPVSPQAVEDVVERIVAGLHDRFEGEVSSLTVGEQVMEALRALDGVAYVRFASVYRRFEEGIDFVQAVKKLEIRHDTATYRLPGF